MSEQAPETGSTAEAAGQAPPRIYVASLSDYNAGRLHGAWIDAVQEIDELHGAIADMLAGSSTGRAEEWAIHDYEGFGPVELSEYESLANVARLARGIAEHGPAYAAWVGVGWAGGGSCRCRFRGCLPGPVAVGGGVRRATAGGHGRD